MKTQFITTKFLWSFTKMRITLYIIKKSPENIIFIKQKHRSTPMNVENILD